MAYSVNCGYAENWVFRSQNTGQKSSGLETKWWEIGLTGADREVPLFLESVKSMRAFDEILLSLMCSCCGTFSIHSFYFLRHNNHTNSLTKLTLMLTQQQQYSKPVHMEVM